MKYHPYRVRRHHLTNQWELPDCPRNLLPTVAWMLDLLEREGEITNYTTTAELDKFLMVRWWQDREDMRRVVETGDVEEFQRWFIKTALYPDIIKSSRLWMRKHDLIELPKAVEKHSQQMHEMITRSRG